MHRLKALVICSFILFLPLVVKGGEPEPFSLWLYVRSVIYETSVEEPYVEVAVYSTENRQVPLFQGFTNGRGWLELGLFAELPQRLYIEVKRDRVDSAMEHTLPLVTSNDVSVEARAGIHCWATYDHDQEANDCDCW